MGTAVVALPGPAGQMIPLSNMRKVIARRLSESMFSAPHFYVTIDIDMGQAVLVREQLIAGEQVKVSFNDLVVKACAKALTKLPDRQRQLHSRQPSSPTPRLTSAWPWPFPTA